MCLNYKPRESHKTFLHPAEFQHEDGLQLTVCCWRHLELLALGPKTLRSKVFHGRGRTVLTDCCCDRMSCVKFLLHTANLAAGSFHRGTQTSGLNSHAREARPGEAHDPNSGGKRKRGSKSPRGVLPITAAQIDSCTDRWIDKNWR